MTVLDAVLGDRAGAYLLGSSLLVITLATIAAIIDIPLHNLQEAGLGAPVSQEPLLPPRLLLIGAPATVLTFLAAAAQTYIVSTPLHEQRAGQAFFLVINVGFVLAVVIWALASPLGRHWGLGLGAFGLGLALLFPLLALVLRLNFQPFGALTNLTDRLTFAVVVGGILFCLGACLASILALLVYVARAAARLVTEHRRHTSLASSLTRRTEGSTPGTSAQPGRTRPSLERRQRGRRDAADPPKLRQG